MKILMVCLGNICRSPLAEGILRHKLHENFYIDSCGTSSFHQGNPPDKRSIAIAKSNGIDISNLQSRGFQKNDFEKFDIIYAMDHQNALDLKKLASNKVHSSKVKLILEENPTISDKNVPDPYYGSISDFEHVFQLLNDTTDYIASKFTT